MMLQKVSTTALVILVMLLFDFAIAVGLDALGIRLGLEIIPGIWHILSFITVGAVIFLLAWKMKMETITMLYFNFLYIIFASFAIAVIGTLFVLLSDKTWDFVEKIIILSTLTSINSIGIGIGGRLVGIRK